MQQYSRIFSRTPFLLRIKIACHGSHMTIGAILSHSIENAGHAHMERDEGRSFWSTCRIKFEICAYSIQCEAVASLIRFRISIFHFILFSLFDLFVRLFVRHFYSFKQPAPYLILLSTHCSSRCWYTCCIRKKVLLSNWKHPRKRQVNKSNQRKNECNLCNTVWCALQQRYEMELFNACSIVNRCHTIRRTTTERMREHLMWFLWMTNTKDMGTIKTAKPFFKSNWRRQ